MVSKKTLLILTAIAILGPFARAQANRVMFTAKELTQGYGDAYVLAKPKAEQRAVIDDEERAEGTAVAKAFNRMGGLRVIKLNPGETPKAGIDRLRATGRYEFVEVDRIKRAFDTTPNDPDFSSQWALNNTGSNPGAPAPALAGADIHAPAAWSIRNDASSIIVAVIDTGLQLTHSDIGTNLWTNTQENRDVTVNGANVAVNDLHGINATVLSPVQAGTNQPNTAYGDPSDDNGHGTHVSGILGALGNNGTDISGVAWHVQIMPLKFLDSTGSGRVSDEIKCIDFAISHGAAIINASFGSQQFDATELTALQAAQAAGIIIVAAAGNSVEDNDLTPSYPASYGLDNIVAVACSDDRDDATFFSSFGSGNVELFAPGDAIFSLYFSPSNDSATAVLSGTSMSTPFVSGSLALLKAQFPSDTPRQLINRLLRSVDTNPNFAGRVQTGGRLNLARALGSTDNRPFNDDFATRARVAGSALSIRSSNVGATRESAEPVIAGNSGGASLWWEWTAPADGLVTIATTGSPYATLVGVYTGSSLGALKLIASDATPGAGASSVSFTAHTGTTYKLTVDRQNGANPGLTIVTVGYANDSFATPVTLSGPSVGLTSTNQNATRESGEPEILGQAGGHSVWYLWTAPKNGRFQISAFSQDFDPLLAVYTGSSLGGLALVSSAQGGTIKSSSNAPASVCTCSFNATAGTNYRITIDGLGDANVTGTGVVDQNGNPAGAGQFTLAIDDARWQAVASDSITCAPAVAPDGTVYVGSVDQTFYAFNPDGSTKWTYAAGGNFDTSAASVAADGTIYAGADNGNLYAFNPVGTVKWKHALSNALACGPTIAPDGTILIKDQGSTLYALNPTDGSRKWTFSIPGSSYAPATIAPDGTIYLGSDNSQVYALNPSGSLKWTFTADGPIFTAAAIDAGGNLYFGTLTGNFYSISPGGAQLWTFKAGNSISSSPVLGSNGDVYFGSYDRKLYALKTANGLLDWSYSLGGEVRASSPAVDANGVVYVGCYDNNLYAVNSNGTLNRIFATDDWVRSSPAIFGTTLYFGSNDHRLYAFDIGAGLAGSAWPMHLYNARRLGRAANDSLAITVQPQPQSIAVGATLTLSASATGQAPLAFQWYLDGNEIPNATNSTYIVTSASSSDSGSYTVIVNGPQGSVTSSATTVSVGSATPSRIINMSVLSNVQGILTVGFVIGGSGTTGSENLLIRATGPALAQGPFNVPNVLPDPTLTVIQQNPGLTVASNSGWGSNQSQVQAADQATGAFTLTDASSKDSALVKSLAISTGGYTVQVKGASGDSGNALTEVYDDTASITPTTPRLINISCLTQVSAGGVLTAGFVISGNASKTVLIRGVGPTLGQSPFNVPGVIAHPQLRLYTSPAGVLIRSNAGWANNPGISSAATQVGAFALQSGFADAAMLATLAAGAYTVQVSDVNGAAGTALIEVYEVP